MKHLYVIGNGFDIHHGRNTDYQDFYKWLQENEEGDVLTVIDETFGYCDSSWWKHFEQNLASANTLEIAMEETSEHYPDFGSDDFRDADWYEAEIAVEQRLDEAYSLIRETFHRWINQLEGGNPDMMVDMELEDSTFLTFNYSDTLESLYKIPSERILYIHGKANTEDELVLGHGVTLQDLGKEVESPAPSFAIGNEEDEDYYEEGDDYVTQRAKDAAVSGVYKQRKQVETIIQKNEKWFGNLGEVTCLHFYGHSFGDVDLPYFRKILSSVNKGKVEIEINDYCGYNKEIIDSFMNSEGFTEGQGEHCYHVMELTDILIKK